MRTAEGVNCITCNEFIHYRKVVSDENGNEGRLLAKCTKGVNPLTLERCKFFYWKEPRRSTRSRSLSIPSSSQLRTPTLSPPPPTAEGSTTAAQVDEDQQGGITSGRNKCPTPGCKSRRINLKCGRQRCLTHCRAAGGCIGVKSHFVERPSVVPSSSMRPLSPSVSPPVGSNPGFRVLVNAVASSSSLSSTASTRAPTPLITSLDANPIPRFSVPPSSFLPSSTTIRTPAPIATSLDANPNPRFVSHMQPIFTQQWETEQQIREKQRLADAARLESIKKSKQTVTVYAWLKDDAEPNVIEFQDGFSWPHFVVCPVVLDLLELPSKGAKLYRANHGIWVTIQDRHVVTVQEGERVFLRAPGFTVCRDIDRHLQPPERIHLHQNLAGERDDVAKKTTAKKLLAVEGPVATHSRRSVSVAPSRPPPSTAVSRHSSNPPLQSNMHIPVKRKISRSSLSLRPTKRSRAPRSPSLPPMHEVIDLVDSDSDLGSDWEPPVQVKLDPDLAHVKLEQVKPEPCEKEVPLRSSTPISISDDDPIPLSWPADFYAIDISNFFAEYEGRRDVSKAFSRVFKGVTYHASMYSDHKQRWKIATPSVKEKARAAGHTPAGLWSTFMRRNPAKNAALKSARRRLVRAAQALKRVERDGALTDDNSDDDNSDD